MKSPFISRKKHEEEMNKIRAELANLKANYQLDLGNARTAIDDIVKKIVKFDSVNYWDKDKYRIAIDIPKFVLQLLHREADNSQLRYFSNSIAAFFEYSVRAIGFKQY